MEEMDRGKIWEKDAEQTCLCSCAAHNPPPLAPAESSQDLLEFFMEASLHSHSWLNHWAFGDQCPASSSLEVTGGVGVGRLSSKPSNHRIGFLATSPPPQLSHSHFITMNSGVVERGLL